MYVLGVTHTCIKLRTTLTSALHRHDVGRRRPRQDGPYFTNDTIMMAHCTIFSKVCNHASLEGQLGIVNLICDIAFHDNYTWINTVHRETKSIYENTSNA